MAVGVFFAVFAMDVVSDPVRQLLMITGILNIRWIILTNVKIH